MADIDIVCGNCRTVVTVSEVADFSDLKCRVCGQKLQKPPNATSTAPETRLRFKDPARVMEETKPETETPPVWRFHQQVSAIRRPRRKAGFTYHLGSWVLFVVVAAVAGVMRYTTLFPSAYKDFLRQYGPLAVIFFHILIVIQAFKDNMLQGTLCLLVPFYSFYYLFAVSDDFYLRALVMGTLVGIGQDSVVFYQKHLDHAIQFISDWISRGGE